MTIAAARPSLRQNPTRAPADVRRIAALSPKTTSRITRGRKSQRGTLRVPAAAPGVGAGANGLPPAPKTSVAFRAPDDCATGRAAAAFSCAPSVTNTACTPVK